MQCVHEQAAVAIGRSRFQGSPFDECECISRHKTRLSTLHKRIGDRKLAVAASPFEGCAQVQKASFSHDRFAFPTDFMCD